MIKRIICDILLFAVIFWGPWWAAVIMGLAGVIIFKNYWEAALGAIFMDSIYYIPSGRLWGNFGIFTASFVVIILITEKIRKQIRTQ